MRATIIASLFILTAAAAYSQDLTEKIDVTLVNVDVTVTSRSHLVRGLTRDDFEVLEDGVPQMITNFYAVENTPAVATNTGDVTTPTPGARPVVDERFRRKVLVVVDYIHTSKINRNRTLEKLEQLVDESFATRAHAPQGEPTNHGELTHTALVRMTPGTAHTIVVAIHDQLTDAVGVVKQRIEIGQ